MLLQKAVQPFCLAAEGGPAGNHGNAHQARGQVIAINRGRALLQGRYHLFPLILRCYAGEERIHQIQLAAGGIGAVFGMVEGLLNPSAQGFSPEAEGGSIGLLI